MSAIEMVRMETRDGDTIEIPLLTLIQWKHALRLEIAGMKHSRGSVSAHVKRTFGIRRNAPIRHALDVVLSILDQVEAQR